MLYNKVLQNTTPRCTAQYYSSTIPYCKVLLQYYSVLQSTTLYYKVLPQHYSSATLYYTVLLRTTKYHSSITLHYKVLLQYYSVEYCFVLQKHFPVLLCATQYCS